MDNKQFKKMADDKFDLEKWAKFCENNIRHLNEKDILHLLYLYVLTQ
jgi:hypothetical protein